MYGDFAWHNERVGGPNARRNNHDVSHIELAGCKWLYNSFAS